MRQTVRVGPIGYWFLPTQSAPQTPVKTASDHQRK